PLPAAPAMAFDDAPPAGDAPALDTAAAADEVTSAPAVLDDVTMPAAGTTAPTLRRGKPASWYVGLEAGAGIHDDPEGLLGLAPPGGRPAFDWGENDFDPGFAGRVTVGRYLRACERIELRGSFQNWSADSRQTGRLFGFTPTPGGALAVSPAATATLENEVDLWSLELNWWKTIPSARTSRFSWGLGARVVSLTDTASAKDWVGLAANSYLEGEARNTFWAGQLMGAWHLRPSSRFEFAVIGQLLGGALNRDLTEKDTSIVTGGPTVNAERERTDFSWGVEGEVRAMWRPWARVGITASYTVLFLDDTSRGHEILDFTQAATGSVQINDVTDSTIVHTLYFGVHFDI
ncbi:MAG: hypothetical protein P1V36_10925, partial [Planctomycetota bacterium]|nr:hypothetical protein [Planctomycetota bacterium]